MSSATAPFSGFSAKAMRFLRDLKKNNDREWFAAHKATYDDEVLPALQALSADTSAALRKAKIALAAEPKRAVFRIYRDVRFARDKSPYKTNLGTYLPHLGKRDAPGGLYIHIEPKASFVAVAFYQIDKVLLQRWREAMATDPRAFETMLRALKRNGLEIAAQEDALKRMPRGFEAFAESPIAAYFRLPSFLVREPLADADVMDRGLIDRSVSLAKKAKPLLEYGWNALTS